MSNRSANRAAAAANPSLKSAPKPALDTLEEVLGTSDEQNDRRGSAHEGEVSPAAPSMPPLAAQRAWDEQEAEPEVSTFYAKAYELQGSSSQIPDAAPFGWVRDLGGNLWSVSSVTGLDIAASRDGGLMRKHVRAHTPSGIKLLSVHIACDDEAAAYLEKCARLLKQEPSPPGSSMREHAK